ncbi:MAG: DNA methylase [Oscillospiraceae bacterium]|nr:DNA methylase [Oscillospiraceae bacterium]
MERQYVAIDLKSFYASVECVERRLDPLNTNLVVADESRTEKTICLAVSPSLKQYGISGRARLFEVVQRIKEVNAKRLYDYRKAARNYKFEFTEKSYLDNEVKSNNAIAVDYIVAPPRMAYYMEYSTRIYQIYLKYIAPEDIVVYSIDEVFIDVTSYLQTYKMTARQLAMTIINDIFTTTGITATAGIGTNLYLCKIAMDIMAKKIPADENGVRIAELDEMSYRRQLWEHTPITDFWRVGNGIAKRLEQYGICTMGDIARTSLQQKGYRSEDMLYKVLGKNAEIIIDHAWGWEPCTIEEIKKYRPETNSISTGQVLQCPYDYQKAKLIVREMTDLLSLDLVKKRMVTNQIVLTIGYDVENLSDEQVSSEYKGEVTTDRYGRKTPKHAHGTINLDRYTSSTNKLVAAAMELFDRIIDKRLTSRRINVVACRVIPETEIAAENESEQLDFFTDFEEKQAERERENKALKRENNMQKAIIELKNKYGKNAVLRGMNLEEGATTISRNKQIGGHRA